MSATSFLRKLTWLWTVIAKSTASAVIVGAGGGTVYGLTAINLTAGQLFLGLFDLPTAGTALSTANLIMTIPIPASGAVVLTPQQGAGLCEGLLNVAWFVYGGTDPTVFTTTAVNGAAVQIAIN